MQVQRRAERQDLLIPRARKVARTQNTERIEHHNTGTARWSQWQKGAEFGGNRVIVRKRRGNRATASVSAAASVLGPPSVAKAVPPAAGSLPLCCEARPAQPAARSRGLGDLLGPGIGPWLEPAPPPEPCGGPRGTLQPCCLPARSRTDNIPSTFPRPRSPRGEPFCHKEQLHLRPDPRRRAHPAGLPAAPLFHGGIPQLTHTPDPHQLLSQYLLRLPLSPQLREGPGDRRGAQSFQPAAGAVAAVPAKPWKGLPPLTLGWDPQVSPALPVESLSSSCQPQHPSMVTRCLAPPPRRWEPAMGAGRPTTPQVTLRKSAAASLQKKWPLNSWLLHPRQHHSAH
eukprot:RCo027076